MKSNLNRSRLVHPEAQVLHRLLKGFAPTSAMRENPHTARPAVAHTARLAPLDPRPVVVNGPSRPPLGIQPAIVHGPSRVRLGLQPAVDHLGSTRLITDQSGNAVSCYDHYPFGEEIEANNSHGDRQIVPCYNKDKGIYQRFTGKERDDESGLDYFGARYFSASLGRFTGPDVPLLDQSAGNPQSWNLYGYVRNNPLKFTDPNGQICIFGFGNTCEEVEPPQPPPPPSVPEGAPGTRTFPLIQAQDAVRQNPRLQPEREGARRTFCNFATCQTAIPLGAPVGEDGLITTPEGHGPRFSMANEMARKLPQSGEFTEVGPEDAQAIANEGGVAIGVLPARGHGHVVTVRPDNTYLEAGATRQGSGPLLNDVGRYVRVARASRVFGSAQPRYYVPTDPTPRNNSHLRRLGR